MNNKNDGGTGIRPPRQRSVDQHSRFYEWWIKNEQGQTPDDIGRGFSAWLLGVVVIAAVVGFCWAWS